MWAGKLFFFSHPVAGTTTLELQQLLLTKMPQQEGQEVRRLRESIRHTQTQNCVTFISTNEPLWLNGEKMRQVIRRRGRIWPWMTVLTGPRAKRALSLTGPAKKRELGGGGKNFRQGRRIHRKRIYITIAAASGTSKNNNNNNKKRVWWTRIKVSNHRCKWAPGSGTASYDSGKSLYSTNTELKTYKRNWTGTWFQRTALQLKPPDWTESW